jgi:sec-independent protein translocase protein TatA
MDRARSSSNPRRFSVFEGVFQPTHLLLILGIAVLLFGPKKLPELGKGIGAGIRALKKGLKDPPVDPGRMERGSAAN